MPMREVIARRVELVSEPQQRAGQRSARGRARAPSGCRGDDRVVDHALHQHGDRDPERGRRERAEQAEPTSRRSTHHSRVRCRAVGPKLRSGGSTVPSGAVTAMRWRVPFGTLRACHLSRQRLLPAMLAETKRGASLRGGQPMAVSGEPMQADPSAKVDATSAAGTVSAPSSENSRSSASCPRRAGRGARAASRASRRRSGSGPTLTPIRAASTGAGPAAAASAGSAIRIAGQVVDAGSRAAAQRRPRPSRSSSPAPSGSRAPTSVAEAVVARGADDHAEREDEDAGRPDPPRARAARACAAPRRSAGSVIASGARRPRSRPARCRATELSAKPASVSAEHGERRSAASARGPSGARRRRPAPRGRARRSATGRPTPRASAAIHGSAMSAPKRVNESPLAWNASRFVRLETGSSSDAELARCAHA